MTTKRIITLACVGVLAAVSAVAISATTRIGASAAPSELRLHLNGDGQRFSYGATIQNLTVKKCVVESPNGSLISFSSTPASSAGLVDNGLGVKGSGATGTPCGEVETGESLTLTRGPALAGRSFSGLRLDVEMTKNALVQLTLTGPNQSAVYTLQTGASITADEADDPDYTVSPPYTASSGPGDETDACASPNSSGPNSGPSDNCQWTVIPGFNFTSLKLVAAVGTVSLEGGSDFGAGTAHDSIFYLSNTAPVAADDTATVSQNRSVPDTNNFVSIPVLANDSDGDGDTLGIATGSVSVPAHGTAVIEGSSIRYTPNDNDPYVGTDTFTYRANDGTSDSNTATVTVTIVKIICSGEPVSDQDNQVGATFVLLTPGVCKPYALDAVQSTSSFVLFQPVGATKVDYRGTITFGPEAATLSGGALQLLLEYDPAGGTTFKPVPLCINPQFDGNGVVTGAQVPAGETWCIASVSTFVQGVGNVAPTWQVWGHDDPRFQ